MTQLTGNTQAAMYLMAGALVLGGAAGLERVTHTQHAGCGDENGKLIVVFTMPAQPPPAPDVTENAAVRLQPVPG
jgi:hypothetical protein